MAKVLLVTPPVVYSKGSYSAPFVPPIGLAYLAGSLRHHGHQPYLLDALAEGISLHGKSYSKLANRCGLPNDQIATRARQISESVGGVDLVAVSAVFSQDWPEVRGVIKTIRSVLPEVPIIVGGEHATAASEHILRSTPEVRLVGRGEGERTIVEAAEWSCGERPIAEVGGVAYLETGVLVENQAHGRIIEVDEIPRPAWDLVDIPAYNSVGGSWGINRGRTMPLLATRGCPYKCTFCSSPQMWGTRYVMRDVRDVVDEIEEYVAKYQATNIDFYDLTAVVRKSWILEFCEEVSRRNLGITWQLPSGTRSEALDEEVLQAMYKAGCRNVTYAPESGSTRTLEIIKKKVSLPRLLESIKAAHRTGIMSKCNIIIGFPHETHRDILATLRFVLNLAWAGAGDAGIYLFSPYPGSALYKELRESGRLPEMSDEYFESLLGYMDLKAKYSFCDNVSTRQLVLYRTAGMMMFYGISYLRRPSWIIRTIKNLRGGKSESVFEDRITILLRRRKERIQSTTKKQDAGEQDGPGTRDVPVAVRRVPVKPGPSPTVNIGTGDESIN